MTRIQDGIIQAQKQVPHGLIMVLKVVVRIVFTYLGKHLPTHPDRGAEGAPVLLSTWPMMQDNPYNCTIKPRGR